MNAGISDTGRIPHELCLRLYPPARTWKVWQELQETIRLRALAEIEAQQQQGALPFLVALSANANERIRTASGVTTTDCALAPDEVSRFLSDETGYFSRE